MLKRLAIMSEIGIAIHFYIDVLEVVHRPMTRSSLDAHKPPLTIRLVQPPLLFFLSLLHAHSSLDSVICQPSLLHSLTFAQCLQHTPPLIT